MKKKIRVVKNFKIVKRPCSLNRYYRILDEFLFTSRTFSVMANNTIQFKCMYVMYIAEMPLGSQIRMGKQ